jgi:ABC-type multidrug transport system fused ATPase/permease subunit
MRRFYLLLRRWLPIRWKAGTGGTAMWMTASTLYTTATACALALGAYFWSRGTMTIGTIYLIYAYTSLLSGPIQRIQDQLQDLQQADACIQRVEELLHTRSALSDQSVESQLALPSGALSVEFHHVSFGYVLDESIIHDLTLYLEPGRVLGVVGRTGSGKTTLARLLFRLYDPQSGEIHLGGIPTTKVPLHDLRHRLGMVTQEVQIFHASVRDNLTFFNRSIPDARVLEALEEVGLMIWYRSLPDGLESDLGADGSGLSAGEAQLLAFARVFLANPGLVILDEASSRLDPATEQHIEQAVSALLKDRTAIVIAHRLATLQRADEILVLEDGHVVEHGSRVELVADSASRFARLLSTGLEEVHV